MLSEKAKEEFEKWYLKEYFPNSGKFYERFYEIPKAWQWGAYVDFFDSVDIYITINTYPYKIQHFDWEIEWETEEEEYAINMSKGDFKTRTETRTAALEKACEIYNSQK